MQLSHSHTFEWGPSPQHSGGANTEGSGKTIQGRPVEKSNLAHFTFFYCNTTLSCKVLRWTVTQVQSAHSWWDAMWRQLCILVFPRNHRDKKTNSCCCCSHLICLYVALICSSSWTFWINMISQCCLRGNIEKARAPCCFQSEPPLSLVLFSSGENNILRCSVWFCFHITWWKK